MVVNRYKNNNNYLLVTIRRCETKTDQAGRAMILTTSDKKLNRLAHSVSEDLAKSDHVIGQKNHTAKV